MFDPAAPQPLSLRERVRTTFGRRATGLIVALALEALLLLLLITLGQNSQPGVPDGPALTTFDATETADTAEEPRPEDDSPPPQADQPPTPQPPQPQDSPPQPVSPPAVSVRPDTSAPALIPLDRSEMARADIARPPARPASPAAGPPAPAYGPPNTGSPGDSQRVGTAPNGEPMYAARWYREPTEGELAGYLSTAQQGWGLIACKTAPDFRVEDCVALGESPGSQMARAVLAAAWQFKVRPPRVGGRDRIGEWVRIRIDYGIRQREY